MLMLGPIMFYIHLVETERPAFWFYKRQNSRSSINTWWAALCHCVTGAGERYLTELWEQLLDSDVKQHVRHLSAGKINEREKTT